MLAAARGQVEELVAQARGVTRIARGHGLLDFWQPTRENQSSSTVCMEDEVFAHSADIVRKTLGGDYADLQSSRTLAAVQEICSTDATTCLICIGNVGHREAVRQCPTHGPSSHHPRSPRLRRPHGCHP
eukprot:m.116046 g.116046  ORF g.116046 m.116046 type:complete len:129 (+) comp9179_c0_seq5:1232-1618(+)